MTRDVREVLCIGFSVTEQNSSYVPAAQALCEAHGLAFHLHKCGIGGIGVATLEHIIDDIISMHSSFEEVVFELATGTGRNELVQREIFNDMSLIECVKAIADSALRRNKVVRFLNLPRLDVDYTRDPLELAIMVVALKVGCPISSVTYEALLDRVELAGYLPDKVHVNADGACYYARALIGLLSTQMAVGASYTPATRRAFNVEFAASSTNYQIFERHGYGVRVVSLGEYQSLSLELGKDVEFVGVTFMCGPSCGKFQVFLDGMMLAEVESFDQHCYYERFNSAFFTPTRGRRLSVHLLADSNDLVPLKGDKWVGRKRMSFVHALYRCSRPCEPCPGPAPHERSIPPQTSTS